MRSPLPSFLAVVLMAGALSAQADLVISPSGDPGASSPDLLAPSTAGDAASPDSPDSAPDHGEIILDKRAVRPDRVAPQPAQEASHDDATEVPPVQDEEGGVLSAQITAAREGIDALPTGSGVPDTSPSLRLGSQGPAVSTLARSLNAHGFLPDDQASSPRFGPTLAAAVKAAQAAYGLQVDGIASRQLYVNLNASADQRREAFNAWEATVAGLVQKAREQGLAKIVVVNVPSFTLRAIDVASGTTIVQSRVIVGRPERATPLEPIDIVGIKYNPTWTPPPTIMKKDIFPNLGRATSYFQHHGLIITNAQGQRVNPAGITPTQFIDGHYRVQQPAGDDNALGILKFETDSRQNIYLHDTNERPVFNRADRAYSSGCVRVQAWMDLATFVSDLPSSRIQQNLDGGRTYIARTTKVPVIFTYSLADVQNGRPTLFPDVYHRGGTAILVTTP